MKNVIRFTRIRRWMYALSLAAIVGGFGVTFLRGGFNWSVDFTGGVTKDFQVAPRAMVLRYQGPGSVQVSHAGDVVSLRVSTPGAADKIQEFHLRTLPRMGDLATALRLVNGVSVELSPGADSLASTLLVPLSYPLSLSGGGAVLNRTLAESESPKASISIVRTALAPLGDFDLQTIGPARDQSFVIKLAAVRETGSAEYLARVDSIISDGLAARFPDSDVLLLQTSFVGAMFSAELVSAAFWSIVVAIVLMSIYCTFRFKFVYAAAAMLATVHDPLVMAAFVGAFGIEFSATTVAALLTVLGYSINDTIVVFDRVRENAGLMPQADRALVIDTSVTQTLSRTIITNLTAQIAVLTIFLMGTGAIRDFAIVMTVGMVVGTYSSVYIAAPVILAWEALIEKTRKRRDEQRRHSASAGETARA
jgi:preprotein translocase subunit SecF